MKRRFLLAAVAAAAFLFQSAAFAAGPSAEDRATARVLAAEAHRAFDAKDYVTAAERFARADALVHAPTLMLGLARSQAALGKIVAANESLNRILREDLPTNAPKVWTDALDEARKELAVIAPRLSWVTVNIKGAAGHEDHITVIVDGVEVAAAGIGLPRAVDKGQHAVAVKVDYGKGAEGTVTVDEGKSETLNLEIRVDPPPPGAKPLIASTGPKAPLPPPPPPPKSWAIRRTAGFVALGVGGAGIVVGAITGSLVLGLHGTLAAECGNGRCPAQDQSSLDNYNRDGLISTVGFIAGGVIAATGAVLVLTVPQPKAPRVGFSVVPAAGGGTFSAVGSF